MTINSITIALSFFLLTAPALAGKPRPEAYSAICIEHIGESDKPIFPIVVTTSEAGVEWCRNNTFERIERQLILSHVVPPKLMSQLSSEVEATHGDEDAQSKPFGTFAITALNSKGRRVVILDKTRTLELIQRLKNHCKREPLCRDLSHLQARLGG
jgi:hypothetical protein